MRIAVVSASLAVFVIYLAARFFSLERLMRSSAVLWGVPTLSLVGGIALIVFGEQWWALIVGAPALLFLTVFLGMLVVLATMRMVAMVRLRGMRPRSEEEEAFWKRQTSEDQTEGFNRELELKRRLTVDEGWAFLVSLREAELAKELEERESRDWEDIAQLRREKEIDSLPCCVTRKDASVHFQVSEAIRLPVEGGGALELGVGSFAGRISVAAPKADDTEYRSGWEFDGEVQVTIRLRSLELGSIEFTGPVYLNSLTDFRKLMPLIIGGEIKLHPWLEAPSCFHRKFAQQCVARGLWMEAGGYDVFDFPFGDHVYECRSRRLRWDVSIAIAPSGRKAWFCISRIFATFLKEESVDTGVPTEVPSFYFITDVKRLIQFETAQARLVEETPTLLV